MWVLQEKINMWYDFRLGAHHFDAVELTAGETLDVTIEVKFMAKNLLPADYSFVVWAEKSPVTIDVTSHGHESQHFPTY